jgi:hypothetical protein
MAGVADVGWHVNCIYYLRDRLFARALRAKTED